MLALCPIELLHTILYENRGGAKRLDRYYR